MKCPKCGSKNTEVDISASTGYLSWGLSDWQCNNCAYSGRMLEKIPEGAEFEENSFEHEAFATESQLKEFLIIMSPIIIAILAAIISRFI